jgi:hypothetical protein
VPGKEEGAGVHQSGGSTMRQRKWRRAAVTLGWSPTWRRGSGGGKPARWTLGTSLRRSGVDGRDERRTGEKIFGRRAAALF